MPKRAPKEASSSSGSPLQGVLPLAGTPTCDSESPVVTPKRRKAIGKEAKPSPRCPLSHQRSVPPDASPNNRVLCVGWGPGADEVPAGRPFVGKSGQLLRAMLREAGLLNMCGFANVCLYRPPPPRTKPTAAEIKGCLPVLLRTVGWVNPEVIICLGDVPGRVLGGFKGSVGSMVGKFRRRSDGILLVTTYHPAALLRARGTSTFGTYEHATKEVFRQVAERLAAGPGELMPQYDYLLMPVGGLTFE